jgi:hypothetical protein
MVVLVPTVSIAVKYTAPCSRRVFELPPDDERVPENESVTPSPVPKLDSSIEFIRG